MYALNWNIWKENEREKRVDERPGWVFRGKKRSQMPRKELLVTKTPKTVRTGNAVADFVIGGQEGNKTLAG